MPRVPGVFCGLYSPRTWVFSVDLCWFWHLKLSWVPEGLSSAPFVLLVG